MSLLERGGERTFCSGFDASFFGDLPVLQYGKALVQLLVAHIKHRQEVFYKGCVIGFAFVPATAGFLQGSIIKLLVIIYLLLEGNVLACQKIIFV